jgi:hypothetical protein
MRLGESKHGSSDDGSVIDYKVESVALQVSPPENVSDRWQIEHTGFEAGITGGVKRVLAGQSHVFRTRLAHRVGHIEPVTKQVSGLLVNPAVLGSQVPVLLPLAHRRIMPVLVLHCSPRSGQRSR